MIEVKTSIKELDPAVIYARHMDFSVLAELMRVCIETAWRAGYAAKQLPKPKTKKARKHK